MTDHEKQEQSQAPRTPGFRRQPWLARLPWPARTLLLGLTSFFRTRVPDDAAFRSGLIMASSTVENASHMVEVLLAGFPQVRFHILADDRSGYQLQARWPEQDIQVYPIAAGRQEKLALLAGLQEQEYDFCALLFGGDAQYDFLKGLGIFSGARYLRVWTETDATFYFMVRHIRPILRYLIWRSKQEPKPGAYTASRFPSLGSAVGYVICLVRVLPMLRAARQMRGMKNPFFDAE